MKTFTYIKSNRSGFTLIELLIGIVIIGIILGGISQLLGHILSTYNTVQSSQESVPQARYALERMVTFVQESDYIGVPDTTSSTRELTVSERVSDQYDNISHAYKAEGDGLLDADNNLDGLINDGVVVPAELITFRLDETDATIPCLNKCLKEKMPNYGTSQTGDHKAETIICEHVTAFSCRRLLRPDGTLSGIVEIALTVQKGSATVTMKTTAKSRWVE